MFKVKFLFLTKIGDLYAILAENFVVFSFCSFSEIFTVIPDKENSVSWFCRKSNKSQISRERKSGNHFSSRNLTNPLKMPAQTADSEALPKVPDLRIAQCKFLLELEPNNEPVKKELLQLVKEQNAAPIYANLVKDLGWKMDKKLHDEMAKKNEEELKTLQDKVEEAEKNHGESEIRYNYFKMCFSIQKIFI